MSRIEKAMEKAAQLRNFPGGSEVAIEGDKKASQQLIRQHSPPPPMDNGEIKTQIQNPLLATLCDPHSPVSEEYRKLKLAIISFTQRDGFKNVIMVTSSVSCEGKSIVSLNLAISLAQEYDLTVLLVDADLRKPSIHDYLGISPEKGLSDYLAGEASLSDLLIKTGIGRLNIISAGAPLRNPVELFSSQRMKEFISEIKYRYPDRIIIIDTPPVLPFAELRSLTAMADGVLFVIREGAVTPENISEALHALDSSKLIGAVYNDASTVNLDGRSRYYYYGYGDSKQ
jgi:protein-tyrosine kinase